LVVWIVQQNYLAFRSRDHEVVGVLKLSALAVFKVALVNPGMEAMYNLLPEVSEVTLAQLICNRKYSVISKDYQAALHKIGHHMLWFRLQRLKIHVVKEDEVIFNDLQQLGSLVDWHVSIAFNLVILLPEVSLKFLVNKLFEEIDRAAAS
jgi:hypothetical protein